MVIHRIYGHHTIRMVKEHGNQRIRLDKEYGNQKIRLDQEYGNQRIKAGQGILKTKDKYQRIEMLMDRTILRIMETWLRKI
jgi:hypothetical protein